MLTDELRVSLIELTEQLGRLLRTAAPRLSPGEHECLRRSRNAALVVLGEARDVLDADTQAITLRQPDPMWLPSPKMGERLHARRELRREWRYGGVEPFAARQRPPGGVDPFAAPSRPRP